MKRNRLFVFACVIALGTSLAIAQEPQLRDDGRTLVALTRLQIEVVRNGSIVARPDLMGEAGRELRVALDGQFAVNPVLKGLRETVTITPTVKGDDIFLAFNIASGGKQFRPSLMISKDVRGSVEWTAADGQPIRLAVSWGQ
jgi:hypothetical protein